MSEQTSHSLLQYENLTHLKFKGINLILAVLEMECGSRRLLRDCVDSLIRLNVTTIRNSTTHECLLIEQMLSTLRIDLSTLKSQCFRFMDVIGLDQTLASAQHCGLRLESIAIELE